MCVCVCVCVRVCAKSVWFFLSISPSVFMSICLISHVHAIYFIFLYECIRTIITNFSYVLSFSVWWGERSYVFTNLADDHSHIASLATQFCECLLLDVHLKSHVIEKKKKEAGLLRGKDKFENLCIGKWLDWQGG